MDNHYPDICTVGVVFEGVEAFETHKACCVVGKCIIQICTFEFSRDMFDLHEMHGKHRDV